MDPDDASSRPDTMLARVLPKGRMPHVGVIGAGVSGLRCADLLLRHGVRVTVLEARNRVGGRVSDSLIIILPLLILRQLAQEELLGNVLDL
jgi:NADPH-dependent 2,4-dienoyl-CoA reductase/sulfur reductase-like enzyme